ncbi:MAG: enoyl-CoA hydratase/isomerase family protein [Pseudoruegeria sp.]
MSEITCRIDGQIGHITLNRPKALNALTHAMAVAIEAALDDWRDNNAVKMIVIDATGDRAFCAGGDVTNLYNKSKAGDLEYGRRFWRDEYRLNAKLFAFPKPVASFMQGFTMGGGVGVGCHASHRVVCESSQIAMPEVAIGLIPDVGGSMILANAPGRLGEYLGTTAARMRAGDAIFVGFADYYIPEADWPELINKLADTGDYSLIDAAAQPAPESPLQKQQADIDRTFNGETLIDIQRNLLSDSSEFSKTTQKTLNRNSPLAASAAIEMVHRLRGVHDIQRALDLEYRFTHRAVENSDFIEGIRAQIIDKDRTPIWRHTTIEAVPPLEVTRMLMPLADKALWKQEERP